VRSNLDPFDQYDDDALWVALRQVSEQLPLLSLSPQLTLSPWLSLSLSLRCDR
jgi:hypothetical protein